MVIDAYQQALKQYSERPVPWIVFNGVYLMVSMIIPVLGGLALMPNLIRETTIAVEEERDPDIARLFELESLGEDLGTMTLYASAQIVGMFMCLVGWPVAWVLFWMTPEIRADRMVGVVDAMKLSASFVMSHLGQILGFVIITSLLVGLGTSLFGLGNFLVAPVITLGWSYYLIESRPALRELADRKGYERLAA